MTHSLTENQLLEQPAVGLFDEPGWQTVSALEETFGAGRTRDLTLARLLSGQIEVEAIDHA
ncbi:MAG: hypothetical protein MUC50_21140 [Myxococcota bacterium]|nr:hypothetical protein [Myxococcota bacterium]